jgi:PAS domain S-box-containing protein
MTSQLSHVVLNVDDDDGALLAKTRILRRAGFDVCEARDGATALAMVAEKSPQLVLLDSQLPDMSGVEVCRRIKSEPAWRRIPVLQISSTPVSEADQQAAIGSGAEIYLVEPLAPEELITVVRTLMRLRQTEAGLAASEERLRLATESAGIATWELDLRSGSAVWDAQMEQMLGLPPGSGRTADIEQWKARIQADDRAETIAAFERAHRAKGPFTHALRIVRADDSKERWIAASGLFHVDDVGSRSRFIGIMQDVTEQRRADAERNDLLRRESRARLAAEDAARLKDQFLATLSHELRTPMSSVLGWLHLVRSGRLPVERHAQALETIERNARLQNQLINDLLDVSRIITGQLRIECERVVPSGILTAAIDTVRPQAASRQIVIRLNVQDDGAIVWADPTRLEQVFNNLLVNAIKFSSTDSEIDVALRCESDRVVVTVQDRGEGISADMLALIFDRFRQADGSITRKHGGMGLGLAIARHILDLHGGSVTAESAGIGQGAKFTVVLPRLLVTNAPPEPATPTDATNDRRPEPNALRGIHALAVDDDPTALAMLVSMLELGGAKVTPAQSADEAVGKFRSQSGIAVVLSDIGMPGRDGYDLMRSLRGDFGERGARFAAIALTGYARDEDQVRALHAGYDAHLAKPFAMTTLFSLILELTKELATTGRG